MLHLEEHMSGPVALVVAFLICLAISIYSLASGTTVFGYNNVTRKTKPVSYWIATSIYCILTVACLLAILFPSSFDPNTLQSHLL